MRKKRVEDAPVLRHFHKRRPENGAKYLRACEAAGLVDPDDVRLITDFITEYRATHRILPKRTEHYYDKLKNWRKYIGPYRTNTITDLYKGIARLDEYLFRGKPLKQNTKHDYIITLKIFYRWLIQKEHSSISLHDIEKIKPPEWDTNTVHFEDIPTEAEILALYRVSGTRDRAMFSMMHEVGFRPGEIAAMQWKDITWHPDGIKIRVKFKTKYSRLVTLVSSMRYLEEWMNEYPFEPTGDNPVFVTRNGFSLSDAVVSKQLRKAVDSAGIKRHVTPKTLRHAWATHTRANGGDTETMKEVGWGNRNTKMLVVYDHGGTKAAEEWAYRQAGVIRPEMDRSERLTANQCLSCLGINAPTDRVCRQCGRSLEGNVVVLSDNINENERYHSYRGPGDQDRISLRREGRIRKITNRSGREFTVNIKPRHTQGFA